MNYYYERYLYNNGGSVNLFLDIHGKPVKRTPWQFPYSYDPYVIFKSEFFTPKDNPYYHDRIEYCYYSREEQDNALEQIRLKRYGAEYERFSWKNPSHVENFLSILMNKAVRCTAITEGANYSTGYPYWIVYVQDK